MSIGRMLINLLEYHSDGMIIHKQRVAKMEYCGTPMLVLNNGPFSLKISAMVVLTSRMMEKYQNRLSLTAAMPLFTFLSHNMIR